MTKVTVSGFTISFDGFAAGPDQCLKDPLGKRGLELHQWFFEDDLYPVMDGSTDDSELLDRQIAVRAMEGFGAFILGRNMFGPIRGPWAGEVWKGWWGENPPWHAPTFILTNHPHEPIEMLGGTTYHFVTNGIHAALDQARIAAGDKNVKIGGGVATVRQYLEAGLIDELQLSMAPVFLGSGELLLDGVDLSGLGFEIVKREVGARALHVTLRNTGPLHLATGSEV